MARKTTYGWMVPAQSPGPLQTLFKFKCDAEAVARSEGRDPKFTVVAVAIEVCQPNEEHLTGAQ